MRRLAAVAAAALLLAACGGEPDPAAVGIEPTATTAETDAAVLTAAPTLMLTPTSTAPAGGSSGAADDLAGSPFSTADLRAAVEQAGWSFVLVERREPICLGSAVPGRPHWSVDGSGSEFGPVFVLWAYPDAAALRDDWDAVPGEAPRPRFQRCELPTGFVYWQENLVLAFAAWRSADEEFPPGAVASSPGDHPAVHAFLRLSE